MNRIEQKYRVERLDLAVEIMHALAFLKPCLEEERLPIPPWRKRDTPQGGWEKFLCTTITLLTSQPAEKIMFFSIKDPSPAVDAMTADFDNAEEIPYDPWDLFLNHVGHQFSQFLWEDYNKTQRSPDGTPKGDLPPLGELSYAVPNLLSITITNGLIDNAAAGGSLRKEQKGISFVYNTCYETIITTLRFYIYNLVMNVNGRSGTEKTQALYSLLHTLPFFIPLALVNKESGTWLVAKA